MRWPANVIAYYIKATGMRPSGAVVAVAIALDATEGEDAYWWQQDRPNGRTFAGAFAIPLDVIDPDWDLDPLKLSQAAQIVRRLTGPQGDRWDWSPAFAANGWRRRLEDAQAGLARPAPGIADDTAQMVIGGIEAAAAVRQSIRDARASMLASVDHLRLQV